MADLPESTPELERFIARRLCTLDGQEWQGLEKDQKQVHIKKARQILSAERSFLSRKPAEGGGDAVSADEG